MQNLIQHREDYFGALTGVKNTLAGLNKNNRPAAVVQTLKLDQIPSNINITISVFTRI